MDQNDFAHAACYVAGQSRDHDRVVRYQGVDVGRVHFSDAPGHTSYMRWSTWTYPARNGVIEIINGDVESAKVDALLAVKHAVLDAIEKARTGANRAG